MSRQQATTTRPFENFDRRRITRIDFDEPSTITVQDGIDTEESLEMKILAESFPDFGQVLPSLALDRGGPDRPTVLKPATTAPLFSD